MIGAFTTKTPIHSYLQRFSHALAAVSLVHRRGARKYAPYSWCNAPEKSDSTLANNLDALCRHLCAHSIGIPRDPEGLPHLFHMCCRAGMLVTMTYRAYFLESSFPIPADTVEDNKEQVYLSSWWTPEEIISLTKFRESEYEKFMTGEEYDEYKLQQHLWTQAIDAASTVNSHTPTVSKNNPVVLDTKCPTVADHLFHTTLVWLEHVLQTYPISSLMDTKVLHNDDKVFLDILSPINDAPEGSMV